MYKLNDSEWTVLEALWNGCDILGAVVDYLKPQTGWSRNTVHTYLTRMEGKGLVIIDRSSEPHTYSAALTKEDCARQERKSLLNKVYGGAAGDLLVAFLKETKITEEERSRLKKLLDEMEV
ncbi:MAG: BlaI/MecI/CopY family transcriptional regulator [Firmicutes bacterium]|nr:BlaI/MecI/CopY family transcriptional regulator [Bacillota bacterium]